MGVYDFSKELLLIVLFQFSNACEQAIIIRWNQLFKSIYLKLIKLKLKSINQFSKSSPNKMEKTIAPTMITKLGQVFKLLLPAKVCLAKLGHNFTRSKNVKICLNSSIVVIFCRWVYCHLKLEFLIPLLF